MNTQPEPGVRVEPNYSTIHTLIDSIHDQIDKAAKQRKRTLVNTFYAATAKILRLWWTLTMIKSLRNQICELQIEQAKLLSTHRTHTEYYMRNKEHILSLETRITHLINKAI